MKTVEIYLLNLGSVVPGAGSFEVAAFNDLEKYAKEVKGRAKLGVLAYANALLVIPETLAINAGFDASEKIVNLIEEAREVGDAGVLGLNLDSGDVEAINVSHFCHISQSNFCFREFGTTFASRRAV